MSQSIQTETCNMEKLEMTRVNKSNIYNIYLVKSGDKEKTLTRNEYKQFLQELEDNKWNNFDEMFVAINRIRIITMNKENWKLSHCTCWFWLKHYKCVHIIGCGYRLQLSNFKSIGMDLPLTNKRKAGGSLKNKSASSTQPSDLIETIEAGIEEEELIQPPTKIINRASSQNVALEKVTCKRCGGELKKKEIFLLC